MKAKNYSLGILAVMALTAAALAADGFTITQKPKKDDQHKYSMKGEMDVSGIQVSISGTTLDKILDVATDGTFTVEQSQIEMKVSFNGSEQDVPATKVTTVYKPTGEISKISDEGNDIDAKAYRMANFEVMFDPGKTVNIGDSWSHDFKADAATGSVAAKGDYKLLANEKVGNFDTLKIQVSIKEAAGDPVASSEGTVWIDKNDGSLVKADMKWSNVPLPQAPAPVNGTLKLERI